LRQLHSTNSPAVHSVANFNTDEDEIDLLQLLRSLLKTWKPLLVALVAVSVIFGATKALQLVFVVNQATYSKPIRLTFPNAHKLVFPSGAKFSYSDIIAPAVVQMAFERNKLGDFGLSVADLQGSLSAVPYAPTYPVIIKRYEKLMSDKKLSVEQLTDLQKRMQEEIAQATSGEALISLRLDKEELPQGVVDKLMNDIPAIWAERALKEKGVLNINAQLASVNSLNANLIQLSDVLVAGDMLNEKIGLLKRNIEAMSKFEGAQSIADPVSGMKLMDLSFSVNDFNHYVINGLLAPVRMLGLSNNYHSTAYYYEDKIIKLKTSLAALQRKSTAIQEVYNSYLQYEPSTTQNTGEGKGTTTMVSSQLTGDMIDKLVSLSGGAAKEQYKQELNDKRLLLISDIASTEGEISDSQFILSALKASTSRAKLALTEEQYLSKVKTELPQVLAKMTEFFGVSERIYNQLSVESVGIRDQLYVPVTNTILANKSLIDIKSTVLIWAALMFLTAVIVVPFCMIRNVMKARALSE
jgi:hypothetical protein